VLAGLVRCSLTSLRYHADRVGADTIATGSASGRITKREDDRYAFVEIEVRLDLELEPVPPGEELGALLAKAERDCFVGASLTAKPSYRWTVNGAEVEVP
jgi:organic hydroperoxide reductase OsmC/OhrA